MVPALGLAQLAGLSLALGIVSHGRAGEVMRLLRRTRWLLMLTLVMYGYSLPGDALVAGLAHYSPSREGLLQGLVQAWRLGLLLVLLDALVLRMPLVDLMAGLYSLLRPFTAVGVDRDRVAVRLMLTLTAMQRAEGLAALRDLLAARAADEREPGSVELAVRPYRLTDWCVLSLMLLGVAWLYA